MNRTLSAAGVGILLPALCFFSLCNAAEEAIYTSVNVTAEPSVSTRGMYETIAGYLRVKKPSHIEKSTELQLNVPGFNAVIPVTAVIQNEPAPLVVVLQGITGQRHSPFSSLWPSWYAAAGFHVLTFDSTFLPSFNQVSGHGASGHIWVESERAAQVINSFLNRDDVADKVTRIGVVGMSYGGLEALILGKMARAKSLPFKISAIQAWSPPIDIEATAEILDEMYRRHRWDYSLIELNWQVRRHKPNSSDSCASAAVPLSNALMQAALTASFHEELVPITLYNACHYRPDFLPGENQRTRKAYADNLGFQAFAYALSLPYWRTRSRVDPLEMVQRTRLCELMRDQSPNAEIIIAANDPMNRTGALQDLQDCATDVRLTLLPGGGHVGYIDTQDTRNRLLALFENP